MHVLLGTDGSELALEAARRGLALLSGADKVTLLSVVSDLPADTGGGIEGPLYTPEQEEAILKSETDHATQALRDTRAVVSSVAPKATIDERIEMGDPAAMICHVAGELAADVIIVGSHGKGFVSRVLLGSVSEYVMRHAPCPVLVVRAPNTEHHDK
jgi:nucleotide-binding universal stress UspA family protein